MKRKDLHITIIGTGAYGTVLANVLADNGHDVLMYGIDDKQVDDININSLNSSFFNDLILNDNIRATTDIVAALEKTNILILGTPTFALDNVLEQVITHGKRPMHIINVAKGLDEENLNVLSEKIFKKLDGTGVMESVGGIYGPSVAIEVIQRKPTCVMVCNNNIDIAAEIAELFTNEYFNAVPTADLVGCEIAAALKNSVAIASGILYGFSASDNSKASLITIGNNEIFKIAQLYGADIKTFMNFATLGDLILTATSLKSRNFSLGIEIAEADNAKVVLKSHKRTVEGVKATEIAYKIIKKYKINSPLFEIMYEILYNNSKPSVLMNKIFRKAQVI